MIHFQLDEVSREKMILQDRLQTLEEEKCMRKPGNVDSNYAEVPKSENVSLLKFCLQWAFSQVITHHYLLFIYSLFCTILLAIS